MQSRHHLVDRNIFKTWCRVTVRYNDLDPLGHVNNAAMAIFLEQARCELITPRLKAHSPDLDVVLASTAMDYRRELHYPGDVEIGTIVRRVGGKSLSLEHGVFQSGHCAGTAELVLVFFNLAERQSVAPPAEVRTFLQTLQPHD
jgi:acyl-CoA thioester hydrolase